MKEFRVVHIIESEAYSEMIKDLGTRIQFVQIQNEKAQIEAIKDPNEPQHLYVRIDVAEWFLVQ